MYITCEQCSTIFRLDEKRLKPTGSKVRCSQCGNLFIAWPYAATQSGKVVPADMGSAAAPADAPSSLQQLEDTFDQELDGIDLAELDSILERDRKVDSGFGNGDSSRDMAVDDADELDVADLDLDFESALALDDEPTADTEATEREDESQELDLDMDFDLEPAEPSGQQDTSAQDDLLENELDMDFELDGGSDLQGEDQKQTQGADAADSGPSEDIEMVLGAFEDVLGSPEEAESDIPQPEEVVDEDLSLDMDLDLEEEIIPTETQDQELELSLDDGDVLAVDEAPTPAPTGAADDLLTAAGTQDDEFDLTDLDDLLEESESQPQVPDAEELIELSLDEGQESEAETEPAFDLGNEDAASTSVVVSEPGDDDLDLSGFDDMLAADHEPEKPEPEELELSLDDGAELDLAGEPDFELDDETAKAAAAPAGDKHGDGLDLDGFDSLLDEVGEQGDESEPEDMELSLDDDSDQMTLKEPVIEMAEQEDANEDLGAIEDLEFELDAEFEDKPVSKAATKGQIEDTAEEDEELDLSDIEKMLEGDTLVPETSSQVGDLDLAGGAEKWVDDTADDLGLTEDGELDLTDIEAAIDNTDDSVDAGIDDDQELELDLEPFEGLPEEQGDELDLKLEMEGDSSSAVKQTAEDDTEEIDLSDIEFSIEEEKPEIESEIIDAGDIELEFQMEEEGAPPVIDSAETLAGSKTTAAFGGPTVAVESDDALIEEAFAEPPAAEKAPEKPAPVRKKKKATSKSFIVVLILALLGGGGYFGYDYAIKNNIEIPYLNNVVAYVNDLINPKPKDPSGIAMLSTLEINSKFIENEKAGRIFVVTGKVRNGYSVPCKMIHLQGKLFIKGKVLAKSEQSYAGVIISDSELASQDMGEIQQRLKATGGQVAGLVVNPGQTLPFMVVFSELPADLDEFAIELMSATKGQ